VSPNLSDMGVATCQSFTKALDATKASVSAARLFTSGSAGSTYEVVEVLPTAGAAAEVMDEIADPRFAACFVGRIDAATLGQKTTTSQFTLPPLLAHGDRQVSIGTVTNYQAGSRSKFNVWVQVGRAIVQVNPSSDMYEVTDPDGDIEKFITAAVANVSAALAHG
jgi:hypothetical protein